MPRKSEKEKILNYLVENTANDILNIIEVDEDGEAVDKILDELDMNVEVVLSCRRGVEHEVPKSPVWRNEILNKFDENRFRQMLRVSNATYSEMPFCIGYIDGTEIKLAESPVIDPISFFSRKHIYSIKAQIVCDYKLKIRHVMVGHVGSWHDARVYRSSSLFLQKDKFFSSQQWLAGDSAYPLSETMITPFRSNARVLDINSRINFNLRHSKFRVRVEHCFGLLKERFCSLKEFRARLINKESHKLCCDWFVVCCILHNILREDDSTNYEYTNLDEDTTYTDDNGEESEDVQPNRKGETKRLAIHSLMFE
ncbi:putative nuclease HARBI1 [Zeugodacus cucurbitae]|uniref:putative nuclease HARBI1 n=1 Tax=Zeugodacus cucurbitae TaxID=28588 RepID=UPI0023D9302A|nr:putative nuclease HARBI1 [Zeugodacus cucurbitae]